MFLPWLSEHVCFAVFGMHQSVSCTYVLSFGFSLLRDLLFAAFLEWVCLNSGYEDANGFSQKLCKSSKRTSYGVYSNAV